MERSDKYPSRVVSSVFRSDKSINHYCTLKKIASMKDYIGLDAYEDIERNSQVGIFLKFADCRYGWASKFVQHLLGNMLDTPKSNELWVLADSQPIRFSLIEFEHITKLQCGLPDANDAGLVAGDLWADMGLVHGDGPKWAELERVLKLCKDWDLAKRKMVGLLVVLYVGVFGLHTNSRIPVYYAKMVMDSARFERHPWGRVTFEALVRSVSQTSRAGSNLTLHGFVHVLLIWAFEYIPHLGIMCGGKREGDIPLLQWAAGTNRGVDMEDVFKADKLASGNEKVHVVHLLKKPYDEIYPEWPGVERDPKLDQLIRDILEGSLDETFWVDLPAISPPTKRKSVAPTRELRSSKKAKVVEKPEKKRPLEKKSTPKSKDAPKGKETALEEGDMTLRDFVSKEKGEKHRLEKKWKKEFEEKQRKEEKDTMIGMLESMKKAFDVMVFDQVNISNTLKVTNERLEESRIDQAVADKRLRRLELAMEEQNSINLRLIQALEGKGSALEGKEPEGVMPLEDAKMSDHEDEGEGREKVVEDSSEMKSVRKSLFD